MRLPIVKLTPPRDLAALTNGELPSGLLRSVGPKGELHHLAARAFEALRNAAAAEGFHLTYTYGGTYRTLERQRALFLRRYSTTPTSRHSKVWNGVRYWNHSGAMAATPGSSNHGWALAIDLAVDSDPSDGIGPDDAAYIAPALPWLVANAWRYGFSWELQSEPWHVRYVAGNAVPAAVLDFERNGGAPPAPLPPDPTTELRAGAKGPAVRALQEQMVRLGKRIDVDGNYGPATEATVEEFQDFFGLTVDGWAGPKTLAALAQWEAFIASLPPTFPTIRVGSRGKYTSYLQRVLRACEYPTVVDGDFGPQTKRHLEAFQQCVGLPVSGVADAATWEKVRDVGDGAKVSRP